MLQTIDHGQVREIRLARPPVNALNTEMVNLITQSIQSAEAECGALVLSGQEGMFSAGLDVVELMQLDHNGMINFWSVYFQLLETVACSPIPIAAAITGHSPAGGAVVCLFCDYRVMSLGNYSIGLNETRVGLIIPPVILNAMARLIGPRRAELMLVEGALVNPEDALQIGLVDALEGNCDATIEHAVHKCESLLSLPKTSMLGNRANARSHYKQEFDSHTADNVESFVDIWFSDETQQVIGSLISQLKNKK
jgi:3,2-trans-enoyl-CoA isomerase